MSSAEITAGADSATSPQIKSCGTVMPDNEAIVSSRRRRPFARICASVPCSRMLL